MASPNFAATPKIALAQILNADATAWKDLVTAGASGSKVAAVLAASDDTSARVVQLSVLRSSVNYILGSVNVPIASGTDGAAAGVNLLNLTAMPGLPIDADGQPYLLLQNGDKIQVKSLTTVTSTKIIHLSAVVGDF